MDFKLLYNWFVEFCNTLYNVWLWFWTDINILGYYIKPIELLGATLLTVGIIRAIVGVVG